MGRSGLVCAHCHNVVSESSAARCPTCRYALLRLAEDSWWRRPEVLALVLAAVISLLLALR